MTRSVEWSDEKVMRCDGSVFLLLKDLQGIEKKQLVMNSNKVFIDIVNARNLH